MKFVVGQMAMVLPLKILVVYVMLYVMVLLLVITLKYVVATPLLLQQQ